MRTMWLFAILVGVPIVEIALFIEVGGAIGLWPTLAIVVLTALAGTVLMRIQGMQAMARLRTSLEQRRDPVGPIAHGAMILVAGMLLLTPGFFTDTVGLLLLIPPVRQRLIAWGASKITVVAAGHVDRRRRTPPGGQTIDTDYEIVEEDAEARPGASGWTQRRP